MSNMDDSRPPAIQEAHWENAEDVLRIWLRRSRENQRGHYRSANFYQMLNLGLGIPAVALSATVGTSFFVSIQREVTVTLKILMGLLSIVAAVLMTLHTTLNFFERADKHKMAGAGYAAIRRQIEALLAVPVAMRADMKLELDGVRGQMDKLAQESPALPPKFWNQGTSYDPPAFLLEGNRSESEN